MVAVSPRLWAFDRPVLRRTNVAQVQVRTLSGTVIGSENSADARRRAR
jgi:hypothetical protein